MNGSHTAELIENPYLLDMSYNGNKHGGLGVRDLNYTYEELERDVKIGHEIEFEFEGKTYGIINVPEGRGLGEGQKRFN